MGHFYSPPPPIISANGAQPYAPNKLPPAITAVRVDNPPSSWQQIPTWEARRVLPQTTRFLIPVTAAVVNNPPFSYPGRGVPQQAIAATISQPDPWQYTFVGLGFTGLQPYGRGLLPPSILNAPSDQPPFVNEGRNAWVVNVIQAWQPPDPQPFVSYTGWQPLAPNKVSPGIPGRSVDNPPIGTPNDLQLPSIIGAWNPPDPQPFMGGLQPLEPNKLTPNSVDNPPLLVRQQFPIQPETPYQQPSVKLVQPFVVSSQAFTSVWLNPVLASWQLVDLQPTLPRNLNPSITAVTVDNPPFGLLVTVIEPWVSDYPPQQPAYKVTQSGAAPAVQVAYSLWWLPPILQAWQPPDPQPTLPRNLNPSLIGLQVNNPPFSHFGRASLTINEILAWQPPDPPPLQKGPLPPQLTAVPVNNPPGVNPDNTPTYWAIMGVWDIPLPPQPQQTKYIVTIIPPPIPSKELHDHPWFATFGKMTVH